MPSLGTVSAAPTDFSPSRLAAAVGSRCPSVVASPYCLLTLTSILAINSLSMASALAWYISIRETSASKDLKLLVLGFHPFSVGFHVGHHLFTESSRFGYRHSFVPFLYMAIQYSIQILQFSVELLNPVDDSIKSHFWHQLWHVWT
jgi:hypothetical protein